MMLVVPVSSKAFISLFASNEISGGGLVTIQQLKGRLDRFYLSVGLNIMYCLSDGRMARAYSCLGL